MEANEQFLENFWNAEEEERKTMFIRNLFDNDYAFFREEIRNARVDSSENYFIFRMRISNVVSLFHLYELEELVKKAFSCASVLLNPVYCDSCVISVHVDRVFCN